jgi:AcrR family transcriptional regulator
MKLVRCHERAMAPSRGRPRDPDARRAILDAAYELVRERGFAAVTTADIAACAGAGKQTLYRWWPTKSALVLDALADWIAQHEDAARRTLSAFLVQLCRSATEAAPILRALLAEAQHDAALRTAVERKLIGPLRVAMRGCLDGFRPAERERLVSAIYGAVMYQLMLHQPLDAVFVRGITRMVNRLA